MSSASKTAARRAKAAWFDENVMPQLKAAIKEHHLDLEEFAGAGHHRVMNDRGHSIDFWKNGSYSTVGGRYLKAWPPTKEILAEINQLAYLAND